MSYQQKHSRSIRGHPDQEEVHQETLDYLEKQLKEVSIANQPQNQQLKMIQRSTTPLVFKLSLNSHGYLISYKQIQLISSIGKILCYTIVALIMSLPLFYYTTISDQFRTIVIALLLSIPTLHTVIFFLDPGTVFQDEEQSFKEQRFFCTTCRIYRNHSTKHCSFCNKCCKKYDHHCSVFGKCIGQRNLLVFYLFLICTSLAFLLYFAASVWEIFGQFSSSKVPLKQ